MAQPKPHHIQRNLPALDREAARCRRAIPRDLLTGEPIRPDTIKRRVRLVLTDRPEPQPTVYRATRNHRVVELPVLVFAGDDQDEDEDDADAAD